MKLYEVGAIARLKRDAAVLQAQTCAPAQLKAVEGVAAIIFFGKEIAVGRPEAHFTADFVEAVEFAPRFYAVAVVAVELYSPVKSHERRECEAGI